MLRTSGPAAASAAGLDRYILSPDNFRVASDESGESVVLGCGAFGVVYDGWVRDAGRGWLPAAHKVQLDIPGALDELALCVGLVHPNIVRTFGFYRESRPFPPGGAAANVVVIVMERLDPRTLYHMLEDPSTQLPMARRATIAADVAAGVEYLHSKGLARESAAWGAPALRPPARRDRPAAALPRADGDLKPQNVLATLDGSVFKVSDFGLVRVLREGSATGSAGRWPRLARASSAEASGSGGSVTSAGTANLWGTPEFMAPE